MIELVMKGTYEGRGFWITKHEIEELPELSYFLINGTAVMLSTIQPQNTTAKILMFSEE